MHLWHGTRNTSPDVIIDGEQGFDTTYSQGGMWGEGIYFAVNASYSHLYCNKVGDLNRLFFARVNLGNFAFIPFDKNNQSLTRNLKRPPNDFDSVKGHTGNSDIFVVYYNTKVYAEFQVTYEEEQILSINF